MERVRYLLGLRRREFPVTSIHCKAFGRAPSNVWRQLLRRSEELLPENCHDAIDAIYFDRQASTHNLRRLGRTETDDSSKVSPRSAVSAILVLQCYTKWPAVTRIVPKVNLQNAGDILRLAADKGYDDMNIHEALRAVGGRSLIKYHTFALSVVPIATAVSHD